MRTIPTIVHASNALPCHSLKLFVWDKLLRLPLFSLPSKVAHRILEHLYVCDDVHRANECISNTRVGMDSSPGRNNNDCYFRPIARVPSKELAALGAFEKGLRRPIKSWWLVWNFNKEVGGYRELKHGHLSLPLQCASLLVALEMASKVGHDPGTIGPESERRDSHRMQ